MVICEATDLPQRRACGLTDLSLSTCRYDALRSSTYTHLSGRMTELALNATFWLSALLAVAASVGSSRQSGYTAFTSLMY